MASTSCPVCRRNVNASQWEGTKDTVLFECPRCGTYEIPGLQRELIPAWFAQRPELSAVLSHYIRVRNRTEKWPMIGAEVTRAIEANPALPEPSQQADSLLILLGDSLGAAGEVAALDEPVHGAIIGSRNDGEFRFIVASLKKQGLIEAPQANQPLQVTLSFAGWSRLDELRKAGPAERPTPEQSRASGDARGGTLVDLGGRPPRAFISHASEDKERFVVRFAERLRANGVDAWLDQWEMQPGDSLVSKIFDQGIGEADCVVVVVSRTSVTKRWVREELEAAIVRSISEQVRVIPLLIDDCEVPEPLRTKVWLRIGDLAAYDAEFNSLLAAIFQESTRPPLGPPPAYTPLNVAGLDAQDALVLAEACRLLIDHRKSLVSPAELVPALESRGFSLDTIVNSVEVLAEDGLVETSGALGIRMSHFRVTYAGVRSFAAAILDISTLEAEILSLVVNRGMRHSDEIAVSISQPEMLVRALLHGLASVGIDVRDVRDSNAPLGLRAEITSVSPRLRRRLG